MRRQIEAEASAPTEPEPVPGALTRSVFINGVRLSDQQLQSLEQTYRVRVPDGHYWYDRACGAWGMEAGPQAGIAVAGLDLGGFSFGPTPPMATPACSLTAANYTRSTFNA